MLGQAGAAAAVSGHVAAQAASTFAPAYVAQSGPSVIVGNKQKTGTWSTATLAITSMVDTVSGSGSGNLLAGMFAASDPATTGLTPATCDTISIVNNSTSVNLTPTKPTVNQTAAPLIFSNIKGTTTSGSAVVTCAFRAGSGISAANIKKGMGLYGNGVPTNATVDSISGNNVTMSANATASGQTPIILSGAVGTFANGSVTVSNVSFPTVPTVGAFVSILGATGLPATATIATAPSLLAAYQAGTGTITLSDAPTNSGTGAILTA